MIPPFAHDNHPHFLASSGIFHGLAGIFAVFVRIGNIVTSFAGGADWPFPDIRVARQRWKFGGPIVVGRLFSAMREIPRCVIVTRGPAPREADGASGKRRPAPRQPSFSAPTPGPGGLMRASGQESKGRGFGPSPFYNLYCREYASAAGMLPEVSNRFYAIH